MTTSKKESAVLVYKDPFHDDSPPGIASEFNKHIDELVQSGPKLKVVLWTRVSAHGEQYYGENSKNQDENLRLELAEYNCEILRAFHHTGPGWNLDNPDWLAAVSYAQNHNAIIVAESTCRFLRHPKYHSKKNMDITPTVKQFKKLMKSARGVPLATFLHPDTPPAEVRSYESKRGQRMKKNKGGRPRKKYPGYKKAIQDKYYFHVLVRFFIHGETPGRIAKDINNVVLRDTVRRWVREFFELYCFHYYRAEGSSEKPLKFLGLFKLLRSGSP